MDKKTRRVSFAAKAGLIAAAALAAFAAAELAARGYYRENALVYRDSENPGLGFELLPGSGGLKNGVRVSINADGMRDAAVTVPKPDAERRVVVVGGQETFGVGVDEEATFARLAGSGLEGTGPVRVINLSMYSYNLAQKVELACERLARLQPDLVVLQASDSDTGSLPAPALNAPRLKNWVRGHSALARRAAEGRYLRATDGTAVPSTTTVASAAAEPPAASTAPATASGEAHEAQEHLRRLWACIKASGAGGAVMMMSSPTGEGQVSETAKGLKAGAKELGLPYIDAGPAIRKLPAGERTLGGTPFLSPAAHRAAAAELQRALKPLLRPKKSRPGRPSS